MESITEEQRLQCYRLKEIRTKLNLRQKDFAAQLLITQGHLSDLENSRKIITDKLAEMVVLKYNVNKDWLLYGTGEIFENRNESQEITDFLADLLNEEDATFKRRLISALSKLDKAGWGVLENLIDNIVAENEKG